MENELKDLRELVEFLKANDIAEFGLEKEGLKVKLKFQGASESSEPAPSFDMAQLARLMSAAPASAAAATPAIAAAPPAAAATPAAAAAPAPPAEKLHTLKSPIVGTFYDSPAPGSPAFVKIGDQVEVGQVVCIVEAMKLMNEIECDIAGEIVERNVKAGAPVEYGQSLYCIRPR